MNEVSKKQKRANLRLALILGTIAAGFFVLGLSLSVPGE